MTLLQIIKSFVSRLSVSNRHVTHADSFDESALSGPRDKESESAEGVHAPPAGKIPTKATPVTPNPILVELSLPRMFTPSKWGVPKPFSARDIAGCFTILSAAISIWYVGDFHTYHYTDDLIHSLTSLYRWTPLSWESDHIGPFLSLLVSFVHRPYWNVLALSTLSSLLFLGGLTLWASLLAAKNANLIESAVWVLLLLPLVVAKHPIFDNAAHGSTFGVAFFFGGAFVRGLVNYLHNERHARSLFVLFCCGFLTTYLTKIVLIPVGVITLCLIIEKVGTSPEQRGLRALFALGAPALCLGLALLIYEGLELTAPAANNFRLDVSNISISLPALIGNWIAHELTSPLLIAAPIALFLIRPANRLLGYLAAGVLLEIMIVSSSKWVIITHQSGYYLTDLTFLLLLTFVLLVGQFLHQIVPARWYPRFLPMVAAFAFLINAREWNSFTPTLPFTAMDRSIGVDTPSIVEAGCDVLAGDYWKTWPAVLAANDYYFRNHIVDARTGETRLVAAISARAWPIEYLWRPRLDWPDARICSLAGDETNFKRYVSTYSPEIALLTVEVARVGDIVVHRVQQARLQAITLDFDDLVPGKGWSPEETYYNGVTFRWMDSLDATILLPLATDRDASIDFRVLYTMSPDILRSLTLRVNDQPIPLSASNEPDGGTIFHGTIPQSALAADARTTILDFHINRTLIPKLVLPYSEDPRSLGLALDWLVIR
jgi:hypothetical protein